MKCEKISIRAYNQHAISTTTTVPQVQIIAKGWIKKVFLVILFTWQSFASAFCKRFAIMSPSLTQLWSSGSDLLAQVQLTPPDCYLALVELTLARVTILWDGFPCPPAYRRTFNPLHVLSEIKVHKADASLIVPLNSFYIQRQVFIADSLRNFYK